MHTFENFTLTRQSNHIFRIYPTTYKFSLQTDEFDFTEADLEIPPANNFEDHISTLQQINSLQDNQAALQRIVRILSETSSREESFAGSSYHWTNAFLDPAATFFTNYLLSLSYIWGQLLICYFLYKFCCKRRRQNQQFLTRHKHNIRFRLRRRYSQPPAVRPRNSRQSELEIHQINPDTNDETPPMYQEPCISNAQNHD